MRTDFKKEGQNETIWINKVGNNLCIMNKKLDHDK